MFTLLTILFIFFFVDIAASIDPTQCTNYYNESNANAPNLNCSNATCHISIGLSKLAQNNSKSNPFNLCLDLPGYELIINEADSNNTYVEAISSAYIYGQSVTMNQDYSLLCQSNLVIVSQTFAFFDGVSLTGQKIYVDANQSIFMSGSNFINQSVIQTQCSCSTSGKNCNDWNFAYPNFFSNDQFDPSPNYTDALNFSSLPDNSATFYAGNSIQINQSTIKYSIIGIISQDVNLTGANIITSGYGYPSDSGPGCGYFDEVLNQLLGCMGSGGSHGGFGGNSSPQNCYLLVSKPPYDSLLFPSQPGSGGGFFLPHSRESSSGGGVINIQSQNLYLYQSNLSAQGKNGIQGGGGGAGGSISIDYFSLSSSSNNTIISANGGKGDKMSSSGSGGRIRFWNHNWRFQNSSWYTNTSISITVAGGQGCRTTSAYNFTLELSCGQSGSVLTSPCKPGTSLSSSYLCAPCSVGYYQLTFGYSNCTQCPAKPTYGQWNQFNTSSPFYVFNACSYNCSQSYPNSYQGKCLSNSDYFIQKYNILDLVICLGLIILAAIIYGIIIFCNKLTQQEAILTFDDPNMSEVHRKKFFRLQDLPYHEMRLYFTGQNHPYNPWQISEQAQNSFYSQMRNPVTKINHIISKVIKQINKKSKYSRFQKIILTLLKYIYPPLLNIVLNSMRRQKARQIFEEVNKYNMKIPQHELLGIKLHVKPQETVASLEVFNYTKSVLDFYIQNYFPLYILLEKAPFDGYTIDFTDPFLKVFINQIIQKEVSGKPVQNFLKQANKFLKNKARLISCLNYLWTLSEINPKYQAFLWQPPNQTLGIERKYKINKKQQLFLIIGSQNLNNSHFLLNQRLPSPYIPQIQSLRHKFNIRKDLATEQDGFSIWIINNDIGQKTLQWILVIFTSFLLLMSLATLFINILMLFNKFISFACKNEVWNSFIYLFVVYFFLFPLCDIAACWFNYKAMLSKNQYVLSNAIEFNIFAIIKSLLLFIMALANILNNNNDSLKCLQMNEYIWLAMFILSIIIFLVQIMLRSRIIVQSK